MQLHYDISGIVTIINKACPSRSFYVWAKQTIKEDIVHGIRDDDVQWNCNNLANAELKAIYIFIGPRYPGPIWSDVSGCHSQRFVKLN